MLIFKLTTEKMERGEFLVTPAILINSSKEPYSPSEEKTVTFVLGWLHLPTVIFSISHRQNK